MTTPTTIAGWFPAPFGCGNVCVQDDGRVRWEWQCSEGRPCPECEGEDDA